MSRAPEFHPEIVKPTPVSTPKEVKPNPKPEPKKISASDFFRNNPKPKDKPKTTTKKAVDAYKIKTSQIKIPTTSTASATQSAHQTSLLATYKAKLHNLIKLTWDRPKGITQKGVFAKVEFTVLADGRITGARIIASSGHAVFNRTALNAVRQTRSAGPPPTKRSEVFSIQFELDER